MKRKTKEYLQGLKCEIQAKTKVFNFEQEQFENFTTFDYVNFFLIYFYNIDEKKKEDFFLSIPEDDERENFYTSIFHSVVLIKLYQNYFNLKKVKNQLLKDDLIYTKYGKTYRVCEIKSNGNQTIFMNLKFPTKSEKGIHNFKLNSSKSYSKINPSIRNNKNTTKHIKSYKDFIYSSFGEDFFITDFKNRTLVIANKEFYKESKYLPIRYTTSNGKISNDLPFFSYLVECCNDFKTAKKYLFDKNQTFDEAIIIGDTKYRDTFSELLQEAKWKGKVKNIILIGKELPITENTFTKWLWSKDEIKLANNEEPKHPSKKIIENVELYEILIELKNEINKIKEESKVDFSFMLKYTNFYYRLILEKSNLSKGIFQEYTDRLDLYFKSEKFKEEINNLFYEQNTYKDEIIIEYATRIFEKFHSISNLIQNENKKWKYILDKAKSLKNDKLYLIIEKKSYDFIETQISNNKIYNIVLISDKRIDKEKEYLDKWENDKRNSTKKTYILPYLNSIDLFDSINRLKGTCEVLCYENIDEIVFDRLIFKYLQDEKIRLEHNDRDKFFETKFSSENILKRREFDDVFNFDFTTKGSKNNSFENIDLPKEKVVYNITFTDNTTEKFDSTKGVFLVENNSQIKTNIAEITEGATIRFYQNTSSTEFKKIMKLFDTERLLETFDLYADSWKNTLHKLSKKYNGIEHLFDKLFVEEKIHFNTFKLYFKENSKTRFPRENTLKIIKNFCINYDFKDELLVKEFDKFIIYSKKDHSIRQQAGRVLSDDLLDYISSNKTDISNSLKKIPIGILDKIVSSIQKKKIQNKKIVEDE
jgi:hypothetical protein